MFQSIYNYNFTKRIIKNIHNSIAKLNELVFNL